LDSRPSPTDGIAKMVRRLLTLGSDNDPKWVRLYLQLVGEQWAVIIIGDGVTRPKHERVKSLDIPEHIRVVNLIGMA